MGKILKSDLSKNDFKNRLHEIDMTYQKFAKEAGVSESSVKRWTEIPMYAESLLKSYEYKFHVNKVLEGIDSFNHLQDIKKFQSSTF